MKRNFLYVLSYLTLIGFFIGLILKKNYFKDDLKLRFHLRQSLGIMITFFILNILLIGIFYNNGSIISEDHILNNGKEFSENEYKTTFINENLFTGLNYPKSDRIESDDKLIQEIALEENFLGPVNLFYQLNIPGYFLIKKLTPQEISKNEKKYQATINYLEGVKSFLDNTMATTISNNDGEDLKIDKNLNYQLQNFNQEIQTSFIPYQTARKHAVVNYISSTLENNSLQKINILNTPIHFKFLSADIFWSVQILAILIYLIGLISIFNETIKIPFLGRLYQKLFFFI